MFDFDTPVNRRNTNSLKWNVKDDELAMWVADMDFKTAPCVQKAIQEKAALGIYGYSDIPDEYYEAYQNWWKKYHAFDMKKEWMMFSSGVVPAISSIVRKLTTPAEKVLIQSPVYNIFYNSIINNGREVLSSDLVYENGKYHIDFHDLEEKLKDPQTAMMILCNPHNPTGMIWSKAELAHIGALCEKYHVIVVSDEIHCDLTLPNQSYIPFASVNKQCEQNSITCLAASKAFNLAGLQAACIVVPNEQLHHKVWRGLNTDEVAEPNVFACEASIAALHEGKVWLDELRTYLSENRNIAEEYIRKHIPQLHLVKAQATYLLWIDCQALHPFVDQFCDFLHENEKLILSKGSSYGKNGEDFIRINIACSKVALMDGLQRLEKGVKNFCSVFFE